MSDVRAEMAALMDESEQVEQIASPASGPIPLPGIVAPQPFDMELLPESLRPWIADVAERLQCPADLLSVSAVVGAGAILGRKVGIRPQADSDWTELPNLWGCIIGRPGAMKSPAMNQALAPLRRLQVQARDDFARDRKAHERQQEEFDLRRKVAVKAAEKALAKDANAKVELPEEPTPPTLRRIIANDSNLASLGELLIQNPNGILTERDELIGLLRGLDQEERAEERAFYLTGWNGKDGYTFDRIGRGLNLHIPAVTLSVIGGAQPGRIAEYLRHATKGGAADDGLIQRFSLLVWPEQTASWRDVDRWPDTRARTQAFETFQHLDRLTADGVGSQRDQFDTLPFVRFSPGGLAVFREWRTELEQRLRGDSLHPAMVSHLSKYRKAIPALALILHLADGGLGPVSEKATVRALAWSEYLESHAARAYGSVTGATAQAARLILRRIAELPDPFTARDLYRRGWAGLSEREQVADALEMLADHRHVFTGRIEAGGSGGRPTTCYSRRARADGDDSLSSIMARAI